MGEDTPAQIYNDLTRALGRRPTSEEFQEAQLGAEMYGCYFRKPDTVTYNADEGIFGTILGALSKYKKTGAVGVGVAAGVTAGMTTEGSNKKKTVIGTVTGVLAAAAYYSLASFINPE